MSIAVVLTAMLCSYHSAVYRNVCERSGTKIVVWLQTEGCAIDVIFDHFDVLRLYRTEHWHICSRGGCPMRHVMGTASLLDIAFYEA